MDRALPASRRLALVGLLAVLVVGEAGCGPKGPKTYPVSGKVVFEKGGNLKPLVGQGIEIQSTTEPNTRGFGTIKPDGSFTISTLRPGERASLPGAIEGTHRARLQTEKSAIDAKYTRFEDSGWEITVPTTGEVVLKVR